MDFYKMLVCILNYICIECCVFLNFFLFKVLNYFIKKIFEYVYIYNKLDFGYFCVILYI